MGSSKKITVGYRYNMGLHMGLCHEPDALLEILVGDRLVWAGQVATSTTMELDKPNLFGGDEREGGIKGTLDVMFGRDDQEANAYLTEQQGEPQPAYRGFLSLVYRGLVASNNPYLKPWAFRVRSILSGWDGGEAWYPETAAVVVDPGTILTPDLSFSAQNASVGPNAGVVFNSGFTAADVIAVTKVVGGAYQAWSPWSSDGNPSAGGRPWTNRFQVTDGNGQTSYLWGHPDDPELRRRWYFPTATEAQDNVVGRYVALTGSNSYTFWLYDQPVHDNRGGLSLRVFKNAVVGMNPAHIIYQALTDPDWGMGYPAATIDQDSFRLAAEQLHGEGLGLCLKWNTQTSIQEFTQIVADHAGLVYGQDRRTGLFRMRLLRHDYDEADLPVFTSRDVKVTRYQRPSLADTVNEVIVQYLDNKTGEDATTAPLQNLANIQGQGRVVSQTLNFPGLATRTLSDRVGMRELQARSTPLWRFSIEAKRRFANLLPGEPFVLDLSDTAIGVRLVMRAGEIDYGEPGDAVVRAECVEDVFGMPATTYVEDPGEGGTPPDTTPQAGPSAAFEVPYTELVQTLSAAELAAMPADSGYVGAVAARPPGVPLNYGLYTRLPPAEFDDAAAGDYAPGGVLSEGVANEPGPTVLKLATSSRLASLEVGSGAFLGEGREAETVRVDAVDVAAQEVTVGRGAGDTVPRAWPAGTRLWGYDVEATADPQAYVHGEAVDAKVVNRSSSGSVSLAEAVTHQVTLASRQARPYPPGWVLVNGQAEPPGGLVGDLVLEWTHRDRVLQADTLVDTTEASIGPEPGTTYTVRLFLNGELVHTEAGIVGNTVTWTPSGGGVLRVELEAVRDGLASWQMHVREMTLGAPLLAESGAMFTTEDNQPILME